jgi:hypothetical protein
LCRVFAFAGDTWPERVIAADLLHEELGSVATSILVIAPTLLPPTVHFRENRLPKYLSYFERVLERNPAGSRHLAGGALSYADLSLFHRGAGFRLSARDAAAVAPSFYDDAAVVNVGLPSARLQRRPRTQLPTDCPRAEPRLGRGA